MKTQTEGFIWQVLGLLVALAAALEIRSAMQQFPNLLNSKAVGTLDIVWLWAAGIFAGFLLLAGASALISGHVLRVMSGSRHRPWMWKLTGWVCCVAGVAAIVVKMTYVAMWRRSPVEHVYFYEMLVNGDFAAAISGAYLFLLGTMLLMADRLGLRLRRGGGAESPVQQASAGSVLENALDPSTSLMAEKR